MDGPGSSLTASVREHHHDVGPGNSSSVLSNSVRGGDGEGARGETKRKGAQGTAETKKKSRQDRSGAAGLKQETEARKRGADWSEVDTARLLQVYAEISPDKGRFRRSNGSFWEAISHKVPGRSEMECRRRMETLTKSSKAIMSHLENLGLMQLDEAILQGIPSSDLATSMTVGWYNQMCEMKKGPGNARVMVSIETGPVEEGDQSLAACPVFATASLKIPEQVDPVPHQQDPGLDILPVHPPEASSGGSSAGEEEQLHLIPCPAPPVLQALVPGALVVAPPDPGSHKRRHDADSPEPPVEAAAPQLDLSFDSLADALGVPPLGAEPDRVLEDLIDLDGWNEDDTSTVPARPADVNDRLWNSAELPWGARYREHVDRTLNMLQLNSLPGY